MDQDDILRQMETAAEQVWGPERRDTLEGSLRRAAAAIAAVEAFPLALDAEPFPTGPKPPPVTRQDDQQPGPSRRQ